jgi:hypothetical protein
MKKLLSNIITAIIVTVIVWMTASFVEVTSKNLDSNPTYSDWNFFCVMETVTENIDK